MVTQDRTHVSLRKGDALSVTDVQNDFLPGGALGVPHGDAIISPLNRIVELFKKNAFRFFSHGTGIPPIIARFKIREDRGLPIASRKHREQIFPSH